MAKSRARAKRHTGFKGTARVSLHVLLEAIHDAGLLHVVDGAGAPAGAAVVLEEAKAADVPVYKMGVAEAAGLLMSRDLPDLCEAKDRFRYTSLTSLYTLINCGVTTKLKTAAQLLVATDSFQRTYRLVSCVFSKKQNTQASCARPPPSLALNAPYILFWVC